MECVPEMRVALRRLNTTLAPFKDVIAAPGAEEIQKRLKWLSYRLDAARDWMSLKAEPYKRFGGLPVIVGSLEDKTLARPRTLMRAPGYDPTSLAQCAVRCSWPQVAAPQSTRGRERYARLLLGACPFAELPSFPDDYHDFHSVLWLVELLDRQYAPSGGRPFDDSFL